MKTDDKLLQELQSRYGVGPRYAKAYLDSFQQSQNQTFNTLQEILNLPSPAPMWFDYALSANWRGQQLYQLVEPYLLEKPQRYLDVGCGLGGCIVAFGKRGMEVCGIEIDRQRIEFAKVNCQDFQIPANIVQLSILEDYIADQLGTFDVITCVDVIEHVLNVPQALQNMASLLRSGGILALEIPNKESLSFVASDGHLNLFGITLLPPPEAIEYHKGLFSFEYDVAYYPLTFYETQLKKTGLQFQPISSSLHPTREIQETDRLISQVIHNYITFLSKDRSGLPEWLHRKIRVLFATYMNHLLADLSKISEEDLAVETFCRKYLTDFWTLVAYKK